MHLNPEAFQIWYASVLCSCASPHPPAVKALQNGHEGTLEAGNLKAGVPVCLSASSFWEVPKIENKRALIALQI